MTWISSKRLIELLQGALHVAWIEAEISQMKAETRLTQAEIRSMELLSEHKRWDIDDAVRDQLPLTAHGLLHEPAFLALVEAEAWARRDHELAVVLAMPSPQN